MSAFLRSRTRLVLLCFLAIAAFFLAVEHTAHFFGVLPYALVLLCPRLHLFMHRGHGGNPGDSRPGGVRHLLHCQVLALEGREAPSYIYLVLGRVGL